MNEPTRKIFWKKGTITLIRLLFRQYYSVFYLFATSENSQKDERRFKPSAYKNLFKFKCSVICSETRSENQFVKPEKQITALFLYEFCARVSVKDPP